MIYIQVDLFKDSRNDFLTELEKSNISYGNIEKFSTGAVLASSTTVLISLIAASAPWAAFAAILVAWIKSKSSRKIIITTKDNATINLEGLSSKEVEKILDKFYRIAVIDTQKDDSQSSL